jgi:hypothetical protein
MPILVAHKTVATAVADAVVANTEICVTEFFIVKYL